MTNELETLTGIVLNGAHGIYDVHTNAGIVRCTLRGKLKKAFAQAQSSRSVQKARPRIDKLLATPAGRRVERIEKRDSGENPQPSRLSVGDHVKLRLLDRENGLIEEILPRQSELTRKDVGSSAHKSMQQTMLANLDQVVIVLASTQPDPHFGLLDRYLTICSSAELQAVIVINKVDLPHKSEVEDAAALYMRLGYPVIWTSTHTEQGIVELREVLKNHITLFTGPSGVGKSSLVNAIEPGMAIRTGLISDVTGKGKHTTTGSQLYPLSDGGWLADSAGIRALTAWNIPQEELAACFVEFRPYLFQYPQNGSEKAESSNWSSSAFQAQEVYTAKPKTSSRSASGECEYTDCVHIDEEGCAIIQAVEDGVIDERRYRSYVRIYQGEER